MKVLDSESWAWFLFEHDGDLLLDAHCSMSAVSYSFMIRLNGEERTRYLHEGRSYLSSLAHAIHYSVPISKNTDSIYQNRDVHNDFAELALTAIKDWRAHTSQSAADE
ncbi:hypothetical protein [Shewanella sp.]|uniref:hypothetical protein n=1 Tax=Shewanella sp. TaxID=50422 RepID=UPI003A987814